MIRELISDENNKISSSRVVLMIMVAMLCFIVISGTTVDAMVYTILYGVMLLCLGGATGRSMLKGAKNGSG